MQDDLVELQTEPEDLPVYLFTGFLEAGKTKFIQETLEDKRFDSGERTLLIVCEEGEEEYAPDEFCSKRVAIRRVEDEEDFTTELLAQWEHDTGAERVLIEWNGCSTRSTPPCPRAGSCIRRCSSPTRGPSSATIPICASSSSTS